MSWWTQIPLAVNDLTGNAHSRGCEVCKTFGSLSMDSTSINYQVVGVSQLSFFFVLLSEIGDFCHVEDRIRLMEVSVSDPQKQSLA